MEEAKGAGVANEVHVHPNAAGSDAVAIDFTGMGLKALKKAAHKKLKLKKTVDRLCLENGAEIMAMDELKPGDHVYAVVVGDTFYKEAAAGGTLDLVHLAVLGAGFSGKSALTLRCVRDFFVKEWDPTIEDAYRTNVSVDGHTVPLEILDTAGQDDFAALRPQWMMKKDGYLFVFALDDHKSLEALDPFYELHKQINGDANVPIVVVGAKADLVEADSAVRDVTTEEARAKAESYGAKYIETSAFTGKNVHEAFHEAVRGIISQAKPEEVKKTGMFSWCTIL